MFWWSCSVSDPSLYDTVGELYSTPCSGASCIMHQSWMMEAQPNVNTPDCLRSLLRVWKTKAVSGLGEQQSTQWHQLFDCKAHPHCFSPLSLQYIDFLYSAKRLIAKNIFEDGRWRLDNLPVLLGYKLYQYFSRNCCIHGTFWFQFSCIATVEKWEIPFCFKITPPSILDLYLIGK